MKLLTSTGLTCLRMGIWLLFFTGMIQMGINFNPVGIMIVCVEEEVHVWWRHVKLDFNFDLSIHTGAEYRSHKSWRTITCEFVFNLHYRVCSYLIPCITRKHWNDSIYTVYRGIICYCLSAMTPLIRCIMAWYVSISLIQCIVAWYVKFFCNDSIDTVYRGLICMRFNVMTPLIQCIMAWYVCVSM